MDERSVPVVVITGTIGAGKSTIANLASEILHGLGIRHGLLEVDAFGGVYPNPDPNDPYGDRFAFGTLELVWPRYLDAGISRAIVTMTLENPDVQRSLLEALSDPPATVVRLEASSDICKDRIKAREFGPLREVFLDKTEWLAERMRRLGIGDIVLTNEEEPRLVATRLLEELGWI